jgi:hypothetical protein
MFNVLLPHTPFKKAKMETLTAKAGKVQRRLNWRKVAGDCLV